MPIDGGRDGEFRGDIAGMRALAVLLYHAGLGAFAGGFVGVDVFYVLTGFRITGLLWRELQRHGRVSLAGFYARRARRLLPPRCWCWCWWSPWWPRRCCCPHCGRGRWPATRWPRRCTWRTTGSPASTPDYLAADAPPSPVQHYWSLGSRSSSSCCGRSYRECDQWRAAALDRIRAAHPAMVVLGVACHYNAEYHFTVYGPRWLSGLGDTVRRIRATGARVVVLGPTPKPWTDVPECLSEHLSDATACTTRRARAVSASGMRAERTVVRRAGGRYVDVSPWVCTARSCAAVVANLLVYRDDNHLTTPFAAWLAPVLDAQIG